MALFPYFILVTTQKICYWVLVYDQFANSMWMGVLRDGLLWGVWSKKYHPVWGFVSHSSPHIMLQWHWTHLPLPPSPFPLRPLQGHGGNGKPTAEGERITTPQASFTLYIPREQLKRPDNIHTSSPRHEGDRGNRCAIKNPTIFSELHAVNIIMCWSVVSLDWWVHYDPVNIPCLKRGR